MCLDATRMFMAISMLLLWCTLDSVTLPLVIKPKVVTEALQWSGKRKYTVTPVKPKWQASWTYNAITSPMLNDTFVRSTTDLGKTVKMNFLLISLSVTTVADPSVHEGNVWVHYQLSALWRNTRKNRLRKRAIHASAQSSPKAQIYRTGIPNLSLTMYPLLDFI